MQKPIDSLRILIVDDDETQLELMIIYLRQLGITKLHTAGNGNEALSALLDSTHPFDVVFTDKDMPQVDGKDLIMNILECVQLKELKLVMVTDNLTHLPNPPEAEVVLRRFLTRTDVLALPKENLNAEVLAQALNELLGR